MKKSLVLMLSIICLFFIFGTNTRAEEQYGDYWYEIKNGTVEITGYVGSATNLIIPSEIAGKKVTEIGKNSFSYCERFTSVSIPYGVTIIGDDAFEGCSRIKSVSIPNSVKTIGAYAFSSCKSLTSVTIPYGVTVLEREAFGYCDDLTSVSIPSSVKTIGSNAFYDCLSLKNISIPYGVIEIEGSAFEGCKNLNTVTIPNSVQKIRNFAFDDCDNLKTINVPKSVVLIGTGAFGSYGSAKTIKGYSGTVAEKYAKEYDLKFISLTPPPKNGTTMIIGKNKYVVTSTSTVRYKAPVSKKITGIKIPKSIMIYGRAYKVTAIAKKAFYNCKNLKSVTIKSPIKRIGEYAFYKCKNLKTVRIYSTKLTKNNVLYGSFKGIAKKATFYVPKGKKAAYKKILLKRGGTETMKFMTN